MMPSPGLERAARVVAVNVASAVERGLDSSALHPLIRQALMVALLRELLSVMPTSSGRDLADACNRCLDRLAGLHLPIPRVTSVDPDDGMVAPR